MPPISGSDPSLVYSLAGVARAGIVRAATHSAKVFVKINGTQRAFNRSSSDSRVLIDSLKLQTTNDSTPNRAQCSVMGFEVARYESIEITLGSVNRLKKEFAGVVISSRQRFIEDPAERVFDLGAVDYGWELTALVTGHFTGTYTDVATELVQTFAPHFDTSKIQSDLPTVSGGISFTNVRLRTALDRLAERLGGRWRPDYRKRILFGTGDYAYLTNPQPLRTTLSTFLFDSSSFYVEREVSQRLTRVHCEGGGGEALADIAAGETILPLSIAPAELFGDTGGEVIIGDSQQIVAYDSRDEGGSGSLVGPGAQPTTAPSLTLADGAGVTDGEHDVTVVFVTGSGRSLPSPVSTIEVGAISPPDSAPTPAAVTSGGSVDPGSHDYVMTLVTAVGETTPSSASSSVTVAAVPTVAPTFAAGASWPPGQSHTAFDGSLKYAYVYTDGSESTLSPASAVATIGGTQGWDATVPSTQPAGVVSRRLYMSLNGGSTYTRYANLAYTDPSSFSNTSTFDTGFRAFALASAGSPSGAAKGTVPVTVPISLLSNVTNRKLYRRFNASGTYKLVTTLNNVVTLYNDTTANASLGAAAPSSNTATANQIAVADIQIGAADVTSRELYMSPAGGGARKRALAIANNTATTGTITMSDATLAGEMAEPGSDTSGLAQEAGTVNTGSTSVPVAGLAPFRSTGGWAFNGTQAFRYTGFTGSALTGIPASGPGALQQALSYNTVIAAAPCLIGIPSGSPSNGSITNTILKGSSVNLWVTVDNLDAQEDVATSLDPDDESNGLAGIIADVLSDQRITRDEAIARATARLDLQDDEQVSVGFTTLDKNADAGRTQVLDLDAPTSVNETLTIQDCETAWTDADPPIFPVRTITASTKRFTFEELLRNARENM